MGRVIASFDMWIHHPPFSSSHFFQVQLQYREAPQLQYGGGVVDFANRTLNATVSRISHDQTKDDTFEIQRDEEDVDALFSYQNIS